MRFTHQTIATVLLSGLFLGCGTAAREAEYAQVVATISGEQASLDKLKAEIASIEDELSTKLKEVKQELLDRTRDVNALLLNLGDSDKAKEYKATLEELKQVTKEAEERLTSQAKQMLDPLKEQASKAEDAIKALEAKRDRLRP